MAKPLNSRPSTITYLVSLDSLNDEWAEFVCPPMDGEPTRATVSVNREDWETSGRPTIFEVKLEQYEPQWIKDDRARALDVSASVPGMPQTHTGSRINPDPDAGWGNAIASVDPF